jgi:hypothetical protein
MPWVWYLRVVHGIRRPELRGRLPPRQVRPGEPSAAQNACRVNDLLCAQAYQEAAAIKFSEKQQKKAKIAARGRLRNKLPPLQALQLDPSGAQPSNAVLTLSAH